jgi:DNA helicase-2/ATP-dependent DNA helicase PcrA
MEEERRLCYVGLTRAKERLYLLYANSRLLYGGIQANICSRFLGEIPQELVDRV